MKVLYDHILLDRSISDINLDLGELNGRHGILSADNVLSDRSSYLAPHNFPSLQRLALHICKTNHSEAVFLKHLGVAHI